METSLSNKTVIVFGGSSGVGKAAVHEFVSRGSRVTAVARDGERLRKLQVEVHGALDIRALDATDGRAVDSLLDGLSPDVIVLTAGVRPKLCSVDEHSWESFSSPWNQDVKMAFEIGRSALRRPLHPGSSVILTSSGAGLGGSPLSGGYAGAKRMQMFLSAYLQRASDDRGLGIRFVTVVPKQLIVGTEIATEAAGAYAKMAGISVETFMDRFGAPLPPEAVANALVGISVGEIGQGSTLLGVTAKGVEPL